MAAFRSYWWMYLAMGMAIASWVGWMHERNDKVSKIDTLQVELDQYRMQSTAIKEEILASVLSNRNALQMLIEAQKIGPRHTACDTRAILEDLRSGTLASHYPVEDRCR